MINPYASTQTEIADHLWSGFALWLRRYVRICLRISIVLIVVSVPCLVWLSGRNVERGENYSLEAVMKTIGEMYWNGK